MTTLTRMPRRRLHLVVAAVLGGLLATMGAGATAEAATLAPQLIAVTVAPTSVTPPGQVEVHYTATAEASALGSVRAVFTSPAGSDGTVYLDQSPAPLDGILRWDIPDGLRNATYQLASVTLVSSDHTAGTAYNRDGTTSRGGTHTFDFPAKDVTVGGSHEDFAGPTLGSVSVLTPAVQPGQPVTITWDAQDAHAMKSATFTFLGVGRPSSMEFSTKSPTELAAGRMTRTAPAALYNVKHTLAQAVLEDTLGNTTSYSANGQLWSDPYDGPAVQSTHTLPFASWAFTVSGSTYDALPPKLVSLSLDKNTIRTSDPIKVSYVTQDDSTLLEQVALRYSRPGVPWEVELLGSRLPVAGSFSATLSEGGWPGQLTLKSVEVRDHRGNAAFYWTDGTIRDSGGSGAIIGHHTLDLSHLDVTVLPTRLTVSARPRPQSAVVTWCPGTYEPQGLTGYRVAVSPGGRVIDVTNAKQQCQSVLVSGLANATKYSFTVTSQSAVGSSPAATVTATPLISGNVWSAGDVNADGRNDLFAALPGQYERLYRGTGSAGFGSATKVSNYGPGYRFFPGDRLFGSAAFHAVAQWDGSLEAVLVQRNGSSSGGLTIGKGWAGMRFVDGSADFTGDKVADLVGVTEGGTAYLYRSTTTVAKFGRGTQIATGWGSVQKVFAATDVTGDRRADLLLVDKAGALWVYPGTGKGTFSARRQVSTGWGGLGGLFFARDVTGDGTGDLGAITTGGTLRIYPGRGNGTFGTARTVSSGWSAYL